MYIHANNHQLIGGQSPSFFDWHFVFWTHPSSTKEPTEAMIYYIFFGKSLSLTILISKGVIQWFKICIKNARAIHLTSQSPLPRNFFLFYLEYWKQGKIFFSVDIQILKTIFFFLEKSDILCLLKIPENVSNAKFKRCAIVHVELYKVCKKINSFPYL